MFIIISSIILIKLLLTSMTVTSNDSQCIHSIMFLDMKLLYK